MSFLTPTGITSLYRNIDALERGLNVFGYVPFVGTATGKWGRNTLAVAQAVAGIAIGIFFMFLTSGSSTAFFYGSVAITMIKHAVLNKLRSLIEIKPFASLILLLPVDIYFGRIFPYPI